MSQHAASNATPAESRIGWIASAVLVVAFFAIGRLAVRASDAPAPKGADAAPTEFSAHRARATLARVLGDEAPHPTGSPANAAVRDRVVAEFAALGLTAEVQRRYVCGTRNCATVENIVAKLPGASAEKAVLLSAHYDSVAAGPGASDDGAGVAAVLEAARALKAGPALPRDVWLLVNDGEEIDLLGAEAFVREPQFANVAAVVNVEARGTEGASLLIETQPGNAAIIAGVAGALADPQGTSLDYEIYKTLPNDTDFTVYRREGRAGTSFAYANGAERYHTPLDDLAHLDDGSLQHHGDNLVGMARALANPSGAMESAHDAVFFNALGVRMVTWPVTWNLALLAVGLVAWLALGVRLVRAKHASVARVLLAGVTGVLLLVLALALAIGLHAVLAALGATPAQWTAQDHHLVDGFAMLALAIVGLCARPMARRFGVEAVALAGLAPFALIATAAVFAMPGASHVGLLPLLAGAIAGHLAPSRAVLWSGLAALVATALWFPYVVYSYAAVGEAGLPAGTLLMALVLLPLVPALAGLGRAAPWVGGAATALTLVFATLAVTSPKYDAHSPRPLNLVYVGSGESPRVFAYAFADVPDDFIAAAGFGAKAKMLPWSEYQALAGATGPALAAPTLEVVRDVVEGGRRHVQLRLRSARGAIEGGLRLPAAVDLATVRVDGQPLQPERHDDGPSTAPYRGVQRIVLPAEGALFDFEAAPDAKLVVFGVDQVHGLPEQLAAVKRARDAVAVPIHNGDTSLAFTRLEL